MSEDLKGLIESWKGDSRAKGMDYLLVVCDTFSYDEYPVFCTEIELGQTKARYDSVDMQRILKVIKLDKPIPKIGEGMRRSPAFITSSSYPEQIADFRKSVDQADREVLLEKFALVALPGVIAGRDRTRITGRDGVIQDMTSETDDQLVEQA